MSTQNHFLQVEDLDVFYGGIHALHSVNLHVNEGEIVCVIGANGAGKSTLLNTMAGVVPYAGGSVSLKGNILPKFSFQVVKEGVTLVPEGRRIFAPLTVRENLMLGAFPISDPHEIQESLEEVYSLFPVLKERLGQTGGTLSGGEQQMLAFGRALMSRPQALLMDEPSLGLAPLIVELLFDTIVKLNQEMGLTILLVEQNASAALGICHRAYVLQTGSIIMEGSGDELLNDPRVRESYLGVS